MEEQKKPRVFLGCMTPGDNGYSWWFPYLLSLIGGLFEVTTASNATSAHPEHIHQDLSDDSFFYEERHTGQYDWVIFDMASIDFLISNTQKSVYDLFTLLVAKGGTLIVTPYFGPRSYGMVFDEARGEYVHKFYHGGTPIKDHFNSCCHEEPHLFSSDFICVPPVTQMKWEKARHKFIDTFRGEDPTRFVPNPLPEEFSDMIGDVSGWTFESLIIQFANWSFSKENPEPSKKYNMEELALQNLKGVFAQSFDTVELLTGEYSGFQNIQYFKCSGKK